MSRTIVIDPVTRIEGHSKITIQLDDRGEVADAHFHVTQFRGFERITQGRPVHEMPALMARICGICPVSHLVASAKAVDDIMAVEPTPTGADLRRVINLGQIVQSNALSFFHLSSPDLLFGFDADPAVRNIIGVARANPRLAKDGIGLRKWGQQIIEWVAGKRIHPEGIVPGGVAWPLTAEVRDRILAGVPEAIAAVERAIAWYKTGHDALGGGGLDLRQLPLGVHGPRRPPGQRRPLRRLAPGRRRRRQVPRRQGRPEARSTTTSARPSSPGRTSSRPTGRRWATRTASTGSGPLARLNVAERTGTPRADEELEKFRWRVGRVAGSSFHYHYARLIDTLHAIEKIEELLRGPDILDKHVRSFAGINRNEGIGVSEAPRGTLMHHYKVDDDGIVQWVNLVIATGHNNMAMNRAVLQVARHHVKGETITEPMLNRVEAVIRCYDPCLSCSTHALGQMALRIQLLAPDGKVLDELAR